MAIGLYVETKARKNPGSFDLTTQMVSQAHQCWAKINYYSLKIK